MQETTNISDWYTLWQVVLEDIARYFFTAPKTDLAINGDLSSDYAFIIDKDKALRGRDDDPDENMVYTTLVL
jgi:hypothetical protein